MALKGITFDVPDPVDRAKAVAKRLQIKEQEIEEMKKRLRRVEQAVNGY